MNLSRPLRSWHCIALCLLLPYACFAQDILWEKSYGGKHADYLFDAVPTADYGFILAGCSLSDKTGSKTSLNQGNFDYWIWKMDEKGDPVWQKSFGGENMDMLQSIKLTKDGGFILAGTSDSNKGFDKKDNSKGQGDFWVIKLNAGGGEQWQKTIGGIDSDKLNAVIETKDGGYLLGGTSSSGVSGDKTENNRGNSDYWIVKLDESGAVEWQKTYGGRFQDELRSLTITKSGYLVVGYSNSLESGDKSVKGYGQGDIWVLNLDVNGNILWQNVFGGDKDDQPYATLKLQKGGYLLGGYSNSGVSGNKTVSSRAGSDFWLTKIDDDGNPVWQEGYDFGKADILTSLSENEDGSILIGGHAKTESRGKAKEEEGINDYIALKVDEKGEELWRKHFGSDGDDILIKLVQTRDGGYLFTGTSNASSHNYSFNRKNKKHLPGTNSNKAMAASESLQESVDETIQDSRDSANSFYKEQTSKVSEKLNENLNAQESPLKVGVGQPGNLFSQGDSGKSAGFDSNSITGRNGNNYKKQPPSRNKSMNYGKNDFWVVKIKDKNKKEKIRQSVEASPNPTTNFTNVIVGYEFTKGSAALYDLSGRQLQQFSITDRMVPVNLSGLPQGIYIIEIKTDKSTDSVKVIKAD